MNGPVDVGPQAVLGTGAQAQTILLEQGDLLAQRVDAPAHLARVKALLDDVNAEDKGCTERVYRGLLSDMAEPGPLSHLERPNYEFAQYLASRIPG